MNGNAFDLFRTHWSVAPKRDFLVPTNSPALTYEQIDQRSGQFASLLRDEGVTPGDRIVVQVDKSPDSVAIYLSCLRIGAVYVPLNTGYTPTEVEYFVSDAMPAKTITNTNLAEFATAADDHAPFLGVETRLADDLAAMIYTSGTTGRSKGAMLTHTNLVSNALALHSIWRFVPGDVLLHILPIYHVHGLFVALHTAMLNASTVLFCERFEVEQTKRLLPEATVMMGVPTHYSRLLADPNFDKACCSNIRLFTSGSAPMTSALHQQFKERTGHQILERYGMSECGMITSNPYEGERVPGTVGFPLPGVQVRVMNNDEVSSTGEVGVVHTKGPNVFAGYWRQDDKTAAAFDDDDWFITGDVGSLDDQGRLTLEGRSGDMIISGGLNIYPREIEMLLDEHPSVLESAVVGLPDEEFGEQVVAFIALSANAVETGADLDHALTAMARERLASFKIPRRFIEVDELPRNSMGKVQKTILRKGS